MASGFLNHPFQLISTLFESSPPVIPPPPPPPQNIDFNQVSQIAQAGTGALHSVANAPVNVAASMLPHGVCGFVPAENGGSDWVCQAFGTAMPGIVFFVSLSLIFITVLFLLRYFSRSMVVVAELTALEKNLSSYPTLGFSERVPTQNCERILSSLKSSSQQVPPLSGFAGKIRSALLPADKEGFLLRKSVSTLADESKVRETWTGRTIAQALPGWLTGIGLLTTFIAILLGLQHVKVMANMEVQGIGGLVNGLSGKFFSSICALSCAVTVSVIHHFLLERTDAHWDKVIHRLEDLFPHLSVESVFFELMNRGQDRNK